MRIELLPASVLAARRRELVMHRWLAVVGGSLVAACLVTGMTMMVVGPGGPLGPRSAAATDGSMAPARLAGLQAELARLAADRAAADETLRREMARLSANRALADSVDFSALLGAIAGAAGDGVVLSRIELGPAATGRSPVAALATVADGSEATGIEVAIEGFGRTPDDVAAFTLDLEGLGIFDQVMLLETRGQAAGGGIASGFRVRCAIGDRQGAGT